MPIRQYKPVTPGRRGASVIDYKAELEGKLKPLPGLREFIPSSGGRNHHGRVTNRVTSGHGMKRFYRKVDFRREKDGIPAKVAAIEYDPFRSSFIARLHYADGEKRYILAPNGLAVGATVLSSTEAEIQPGNALPLSKIPLGTQIHAIELKPGKGAQMVRSAGTSAQLMAREGHLATLRLPSGEMRMVHVDCMATVGEVGNPEHENRRIGKAGRARWMGRRSIVRGVAMNPVDHPMGGGEGRSSGGRHPCTPWGKVTKGPKTRNNKRTDQYIVKRRGKK